MPHKDTYAMDQLHDIVQRIEEHGSKLIYVAGASASGKTYFNKTLSLALENRGYKVLNISSDDYYTNQSSLKFLLYGTFDHPNLVKYSDLQKNIDTYFDKGVISIPKYSFIEKRRVSLEHHKEDFDFVLVEGLYTISQLSDKNNPFRIFVDSHIEELIFRRLMRDQERSKEGIDMIVSTLGKVFPMRRLYGQGQKDKADIVIDNDFSIMAKMGLFEDFVPLKDKEKPKGKLYKKELIKDFIYNDSYEGNGYIVISEVYNPDSEFLDSVIISKRLDDNNKDHSFHQIAIRLYKPGILTEVHTLLQLAGLQFKEQKTLIHYTYKNKDKEILVKEIDGKLFQQVV